MSKAIKPITREDFYMSFLAYGGDIELLPEPFTKKEEYLYDICIRISQLGEGGGGSSVNIIDNLTSTSTTEALSANQGRILNDKIPDKSIIKVSADTLNNGIGIRYSDNVYERVSLEGISAIGKSIKFININDKGEIVCSLQNGGIITKQTTYCYSITSSDGKIIYKFGNATQVEFNLVSTLSEDFKLIQYYQEINGELVEITQEEFDKKEIEVHYFKMVDDKQVEITEEEFNNL